MYSVLVSVFSASLEDADPSTDSMLLLQYKNTRPSSVTMARCTSYEITGSVSSLIAEYATYYCKFTDTLSKGLTYSNGSLKVWLKNGDAKEDVTQYFYVNATAYDASNGTTITVAMKDLKQLLNVKELDAPKYTLTAASQIVVTYTAKLNENAVVKTAHTNEVQVTYSNDPNNSGVPSGEIPTVPPTAPEPDPQQPTGLTVKLSVETYTTALAITKTNEEAARLQGAVFALSGTGVKQVLVTELVFTEDNAAGTYYKLTDGTYTMEEPTPGTERSYASTTTKYKKEVVVTLKGESQTQTDVQSEVDDNGVMKFTGLGEGTYTLTEVTAPNGYNKIDPIEFTISFNPDSKEFSSDDENMTYNGVSGELEVTIVNLPGSTLPSTGGIGTTIFYVIGSALVLGTVVALVVKRRMNDEDIG